MSQTWGPTAPGRFFTSTKRWSLVLDHTQFALETVGQRHMGSVLLLDGLTITPGMFWSTVHVAGASQQRMRLDGIPNDDAKQMRDAIVAAIALVKHQQHIANLIRQFELEIENIKAWVSHAKNACSQQLQLRGWLSHEFKSRFAVTKPTGIGKLLAVQEVERHLALQDKATKDTVATWRQSFTEIANGINKRHLAKELVDARPFLDSIEKSPLTDEQAEAVICFDNRVLLVASAGSGKTSTMVAKVGYALKRGYFAADRMLLLAFNNDAATELRERIKARLEPLNLHTNQVVAKTFHAFGLEIIGAATGKKPSLAPWVETGRDQEAILEMVNELKSADPVFRDTWNQFRLVFGQDLPKFGKEQENPETWARGSGGKGFSTLQGDVVKSRGELVIANWLFYNGVEYRYEAPYEVDTADAQHRQYHPDFYLPGPGVYLEHWAVDAKGEPPPEFAGYKESMVWKRIVHAANGTTLLETTMAGVWSGQAFEYLERELGKLGVELDPNPDREIPGRQPIEAPRLAQVIRSFLTHVKSNRLTNAELRLRLNKGVTSQFKLRHEMFLAIFERLRERWEERLRAERCIDFEDMLNLAADYIEQGRWESPYELVMVDEFQDASQARARLVAALVKKPDRYLFAVGDDWQSINRFAGADLRVMTDFEAKFGRAVTLKLQTTFRCPQALCDISSAFVQKNPKQMKKTVHSPHRGVDKPMRIVSVREEGQIRATVEARIAEIAAAHPVNGRAATIYIIGRYRRDEVYKPRSVIPSHVLVEFITVHSSKGLEADHVIIPRITSETMGFPCGVVDDPVLELAMPDGDCFEFSEERRLFYVALTRAKQTVTLVTVTCKESCFVTELVRDWKLKVLNADGTDNTDEVCPKCGTGFLVQRNGRYGPFLGCTRFPICNHTRNVQTDTRVRASRTQRSSYR